MPDYFVHESSYVDDGAVIGAGTKIWHFCHVLPGAVIGERCNLGQNVVVMGGTAHRQQREDPEQRLDLRRRGPGGRRVLRAELRVHQRDQSPQPRLPEVRVPADPGAAGRYDRRQRHDRSAASRSASTRFIGAGAVVRGDVPAYALMVGVPARRVGLDVPVRRPVATSGTGAPPAPPAAPRYEEAGGLLRQIDRPGTRG